MMPKTQPADYVIEFPQEVIDKMNAADPSAKLIEEEQIADLTVQSVKGCFYRAVKRALDILLSLIALLFLLVPFLLIALGIVVSNPGPVFFCQNRIGKNGKSFKILKFRTMRNDTPKYLASSEVEDPEKYIFGFGKFLRRFSLDELPQLLNVICGQMSLIGPRPLIANEYEIHLARMRFGVYQVRPGLTGLAQINGRDHVTAAAKVRWDVRYLEKFGFCTDWKILWATVFKVSSGADIVEGSKKKDESDSERTE